MTDFKPKDLRREAEPALVYGPVLSRRLGLSLGINLVPPKTCTFNCIYCQCGRTSCLTINRKSFFPVEQIITAVELALKKSSADYLTFSGSGEPTLNRDIGEIISLLKKRFPLPVAVITNSSLLSSPTVREALYRADLIVPTLACADEETFQHVHRPHPKLRLKNIIRGLKIFRRHYRGNIWLEVMLLRGFNDHPDHIIRLRRIVQLLQPNRIHLNTVVRPPAETFALPISQDDLIQLQLLFGPGTEIAHSPKEKKQRLVQHSSERVIMALAANRPLTLYEINSALGIPMDKLKKTLKRLIASGALQQYQFEGQEFFTIPRK